MDETVTVDCPDCDEGRVETQRAAHSASVEPEYDVETCARCDGTGTLEMDPKDARIMELEASNKRLRADLAVANLRQNDLYAAYRKLADEHDEARRMASALRESLRAEAGLS